MRRAPPFPGTEQVEQPGRLFVGVTAPERLDAHLTAQRDRVDGVVAVGRDDQRARSKPVSPHKVRATPRAPRTSPSVTARPPCRATATWSKNSSMNSRTCWPPSKPCHSIGRRPDELVAGVDRHQIALAAVVGAVLGYPHDQRLGVVGRAGPPPSRPAPIPSRAGQVQFGFRGARRTRIERHGAANGPSSGRRTPGRPGICSSLPFAAAEPEPGERQVTIGYGPEAQRGARCR